MHFVLRVLSLADSAIWSYYRSLTMQIMIFEISNSALSLEEILAEAIDAVKAVLSQHKFTFIQKVLFIILIIFIIVCHKYPTYFCFTLEVSAILNFNYFFDSSYSEIFTDLKIAIFYKLFEVKFVLC